MCVCAFFAVVWAILACLTFSPLASADTQTGYITAPADPSMTTKRYRCPHVTITLKIGAVTLQLPRLGLTYTTAAQPRIVNNAESQCHTAFVSNVSTLTYTGHNAFTLKAASRSNRTPNHLRWKKLLRKAGADKVVTLAGGIKKLTHKNKDMYLLPLATAPTADGQPVVFDCTGRADDSGTGAFCDVSYFVSDGLELSYRFFRRSVPEDHYLQYDLLLRARYTQLLIPMPSVHPTFIGPLQ
jgi:hypothetical protein